MRVCERERTTEVVFGLRPSLNPLSPGLESGPGLGPGAEATVGDLLAVERTAARIEAELLSEVVSVAIMRSEWGEAEDVSYFPFPASYSQLIANGARIEPKRPNHTHPHGRPLPRVRSAHHAAPRAPRTRARARGEGGGVLSRRCVFG